LLQHPSWDQEIPEIDFPQTVDIMGKSLLLHLLQCFRSQPEMTAGKLLASPLSDEQKQMIASLAAVEFPLTESGLLAEFKGALARLQELAIKQQLESLIQKAKSTPLSPEEKQILSDLFASKSDEG